MPNPLISKIMPQVQQMPLPPQMAGMQSMFGQFQQFRQLMAGRNPRQMINNLLASGQMTNEQYQQLISQAKQFMQMFR
jgi:hypothetical protein